MKAASGGEILYFAYGSNMSTNRLRARAPSARALGVAHLDGWTPCFNKHGRDDTAKANIVPRPGCRVWGVVFGLRAVDRPGLDAAEDLGRGYQARWLQVTDDCGRALRVLVYVGLLVRAGLAPRRDYLRHIRAGAAEHGLPPAYLERLLATAGRLGRIP